jgi:hypothetical protein
MKEARTTTMDEFELTRRVLDDDAVDAAALERVRSRLRTEIRKERPRRRNRWIVAAAAAVVTLVVLTGLIGPSPHQAAAMELRRLARIAATEQPLEQGPGEYLRFRWEELRRETVSTMGTDGTLTINTRLRVSTWIALDRSGYRREDVESSTISEADREAWIEADRPTFDLPRTFEYSSGEAPIHDVSLLPTDPDSLLRALRSGAVVERPPGDDQVFLVIGEILGQGVASPPLRSSLFEVAARLEGVELVGPIEDPLGRPGTAVELEGAGSRTRLVFDTVSARLLAFELYEAEGTDGMALRSWIAYEPTVVVDEAQTPGR